MARTRTLTLASALTVLLLGACGHPATGTFVTPGQYRMLASSGMSGTSLAEVTSDRVIVTDQGGQTAASFGDVTQPYRMCPGSRSVAGRTLGGPLRIEGATFTQPAVFADCGVVAPARITFVDLATRTQDQSQPPFTRWAEFCLTTDEDCP